MGVGLRCEGRSAVVSVDEPVWLETDGWRVRLRRDKGLLTGAERRRIADVMRVNAAVARRANGSAAVVSASEGGMYGSRSL